MAKGHQMNTHGNAGRAADDALDDFEIHVIYSGAPGADRGSFAGDELLELRLLVDLAEPARLAVSLRSLRAVRGAHFAS
jgi:hypothetical protein